MRDSLASWRWAESEVPEYLSPTRVGVAGGFVRLQEGVVALTGAHSCEAPGRPAQMVFEPWDPYSSDSEAIPSIAAEIRDSTELLQKRVRGARVA